MAAKKDVTVEVQEVMDRKKIAGAIHSIIDAGIDMLDKKELEKSDFGKLKVIRTISSALSSGVLMIQQETAQQRHALVAERMRQLGYGESSKMLEG